jgi:hypothetical protein
MSQEGGKAGRGESREGGTGKLYNVLLPDVSGVSGGWFEARVPGPDLIIISGMRRDSKNVFLRRRLVNGRIKSICVL